MKKFELNLSTINALNTLVGNSQNAAAIAMLREISGCNCFTVKYNKAFSKKYAPKGYGDTFTLWINSNKEEEKIFSYFLSNLQYAEVFGW